MFPKQVEVHPRTSGNLPSGEYKAVGQVGDMVYVETRLGWRIVHGRPPFCLEDGRYATIHKNYVTDRGRNRNGKLMSKAKKELQDAETDLLSD